MFGTDDAIGAGLTLVTSVIDRIFPDPNQAAAAKLEVMKLQQNGELAKLMADTDIVKGQLDVDKNEASNASMFVAGGRPFIMWVCGFALAYQYLLSPIGMWVAGILHYPIPMPPKLDDSLWQLMFGMLGLGAMRSYDKLQGIDTKAISLLGVPGGASLRK